jgi:hypothetical protein
VVDRQYSVGHSYAGFRTLSTQMPTAFKLAYLQYLVMHGQIFAWFGSPETA